MKVAGSTYRRREYDRVSFGPTVGTVKTQRSRCANVVVDIALVRSSTSFGQTVCTVKTQRSRCADVVVDIALGAFKRVVRSNGMHRKDSTIALR